MRHSPPPGYHWDPYKRTYVPNLTEAQVQAMWPYNVKETQRVEPLDWEKAGLPDEPQRKAQQAARAGIERSRSSDMIALETDVTGLSPRAERLAGLNVASAEARGVKADMVNLPPHYARFKIEPIRFIGENKLDWFQGNIIKYVCRHDAKNGIEDIDKVGRYQQMYKRYLLGDVDWWKAGKPEDFKDA